MPQEEKDQKRIDHNAHRNEAEVKHLGGYRIIYPTDKNHPYIEKYKKFENAASDIYNYFNNIKKRNNAG